MTANAADMKVSFGIANIIFAISGQRAVPDIKDANSEPLSALARRMNKRADVVGCFDKTRKKTLSIHKSRADSGDVARHVPVLS